jgi:glycosyltransferase involved in cell wall biosynthesis
VTAVSQVTGDRYVVDGIVPKELLTVIPNGVDTSRFRNVPAGTRESVRRSLGLGPEFVWLAVGRFEAQKDYPNMLRGYVQVREQFPDVMLLLVGRGSLQAEAEALAQSLGITGVRFLGMRHDIAELMSAADGYVMSSSTEGMPIVLLEAASSGLPIVATSVGGTPEVVSEGESGFLVPPRDSGALAAAMLRLMRLPEVERRAMGERGHDHVRSRYGLGVMVERWEHLYREVLAENRPTLAPTLPQ